jgi:hypothetical protein
LSQVSAGADKPGSISARLGVFAHRSEWIDTTQSESKTQAEVMNGKDGKAEAATLEAQKCQSRTPLLGSVLSWIRVAPS